MQLRRHPEGPEPYQALLAAAYPRQNLPDWTYEAACAGQPTADWFTDEVADTDPLELPETVYAALRVCSGCPVQAPCLTYAYEREERLPDRWVEQTSADSDRFGVYAVPGRIRERFAHLPDRVARGLDWLANIASSDERHWAPNEGESRDDRTA